MEELRSGLDVFLDHHDHFFCLFESMNEFLQIEWARKINEKLVIVMLVWGFFPSIIKHMASYKFISVYRSLTLLLLYCHSF